MQVWKKVLSFPDARKLCARSPAKLIISGEHAVLYNQPALAMAINRYTTTTTSWHNSPHIHFKLLDLAYAKSHTIEKLRRLTNNLQREYNNFLHGKCGIRSVLKRPFELLQYSVANLLDYLNVTLPRGVQIAVDSSIPIGCGMGSSAAAVTSTVYSLTNFLEFPWAQSEYLSFSQRIENLQHGRSSGLDLHLVTYGGCVLFQEGVAQARPAPASKLYIINTGAPSSSTGECVAHARQYLQDPGLSNEFGNVTREIDAAISHDDVQRFKAGIQANHRLLQRIGVVPPKVADFIAKVEQLGEAAKVCGAGSVVGDNAGIILLTINDAVQKLARDYGYALQAVEVDTHGTRIV